MATSAAAAIASRLTPLEQRSQALDHALEEAHVALPQVRPRLVGEAAQHVGARVRRLERHADVGADVAVAHGREVAHRGVRRGVVHDRADAAVQQPLADRVPQRRDHALVAAHGPADVLAAAADLRQQRGVGVQLAARHGELRVDLGSRAGARPDRRPGAAQRRAARRARPLAHAVGRQSAARARQVGHPAGPSLGRADDAHRLYGRSRRQRSTSLANRWSSSAAGSAVRPVWTGPGCTIVLAGATSQWKRSEAGSAAIGPPAASPAAISSIARQLLA